MLDFTLSPELEDLVARVRAYVEEDALPAEGEIADAADVLASWHVVERLRDRARERGLYTPHLPEAWGGLGVGPLGMALVSQECGVSALASLGLNAMAPDEGNMHTLLIAGTDEQLETWLRPLAAGRIRSCFAMTEPDVASSTRRTSRRRRCATAALGAQRAQVVHHRRGGRGVRDRGREDGHRRVGGPPQLLADPRPDGHARLADRAPPGVDGLALAGRAPGDRARGRPRPARQPARRRGRGLQDRAAAARGRPARPRDALDRRRPAGARPLRRSGCSPARPSARSSPATRGCSSCSPTPRWTSTRAG